MRVSRTPNFAKARRRPERDSRGKQLARLQQACAMCGDVFDAILFLFFGFFFLRLYHPHLWRTSAHDTDKAASHTPSLISGSGALAPLQSPHASIHPHLTVEKQAHTAKARRPRSAPAQLHEPALSLSPSHHPPRRPSPLPSRLPTHLPSPRFTRHLTKGVDHPRPSSLPIAHHHPADRRLTRHVTAHLSHPEATASSLPSLPHPSLIPKG